MAVTVFNNATVGIGVQDDIDTTKAPQAQVIADEFSIDDKLIHGEQKGTFGRLEEYLNRKILKGYSEGSYKGALDTVATPHELISVFGIAPTSARVGTDDVYEHNYIVAGSTSSHKTLSVAVKDEIYDKRIDKMLLDGYDINFSDTDLNERSASFMGDLSTDVTNPSAVITPSSIFGMVDNEFILADDVAGLTSNATTPISVLSGGLSILKGAKLLHRHGQRTPWNVIATKIGIMIKLSIYFENEAIRNFWLEDRKKAIRVNMVDRTAPIDATATNLTYPTIQFTLPKVSLDWNRNFAMEDANMQECTAMAIYDVSEGAITAKVINAVASY